VPVVTIPIRSCGSVCGCTPTAGEISSAREVARPCEFELGFQWLCGLQAISHRIFSGFRSENKAGLDDLFVQVLGRLSAEGLISLERVTLDGTKIKANAGGNRFLRKEKLQAHLELAQQVRILSAEGEQEEASSQRQAAARRRAARQRASRPGSGSAGSRAPAAREEARPQRVCGPRLQLRSGGTRDEKRRGRHVSELQRTTAQDTTNGLVVKVEATTDAIDYRQRKPALERCVTRLGHKPKQLVADGDYTNHASVQAAADCGVDFYGSWQDSWKPGEYDACGRSGDFLASAFPYDPNRDCFTCPPDRSSLIRRG